MPRSRANQKAYNEAWRAAHPNYEKERYAANPEASKEKTYAFRRTWRGRVLTLVNSARKRAKRGLVFELDRAWVDETVARLSAHPYCPLTGSEFVLDNGRYRNGQHPCSPSLDRIVPSKGYVAGNVRIVSAWVNMAKGNLSDANFREWCKAVVETV